MRFLTQIISSNKENQKTRGNSRSACSDRSLTQKLTREKETDARVTQIPAEKVVQHAAASNKRAPCFERTAAGSFVVSVSALLRVFVHQQFPLETLNALASKVEGQKSHVFYAFLSSLSLDLLLYANSWAVTSAAGKLNSAIRTT